MLSLLCGIVAAVLLVGCARTGPEGDLSGQFVLPDTPDSEGIHVFLPGTPHQALTDRQGRFYIQGIMAGDYELVVTEEGYEEIREPVQIAAGAQVTLASQALIPLPPETGSIRGRILLEGREDHSGAIVLLLGTPHSTTTDESGVFRFDEVKMGTYQLIALKDRYQSVSDLQVIVDEPAAMILPDIVLSLPAAPTPIPEIEKPVLGDRRLWGRVLLDGEMNHSGSMVTVLEFPDSATTTSVDGSFRLENLGEGPYSVQFSHAGFSTEQVPNITPFSATAGIGVFVTLRRSAGQVGRGVLQGIVTLQDQTSHEETTVRLIGIQQTVMTNAEGRYIFVDIPSGKYVVEASHPGYRTDRLFDVEIGASIISEAPALALQLVTEEDLENGVEGYGAIEGMVTLEDDNAAGGVTVAVQTTNQVTLSAPGGFFTFQDVPAGKHLVIFEKAGYQTEYLEDVTVFPEETNPLAPVVLKREVEHPYVVGSNPPNRARNVGFDEFLDVTVKFSEAMDGNSVKSSVFVSPAVALDLFFGRESELSDDDTLHLRLLRQGPQGVQFKTTYEVVIGQSASNPKGIPLRNDYVFRFTTDGPLIVGSVPKDGAKNVLLFPMHRLIIDTNAPVDPASLSGAFQVTPRAQSVPEFFAHRRGSGGRIEVEVGLNAGSRYSISIGKKLRTIDGQLFSNTPYRIQFNIAEEQDNVTEPDIDMPRRRTRSR
ncbi:MAG TPA: carboxypeptidase regulatory-like domain-containing protein [bacterium]|nr:carboxypeptidase regulatory-like domain-containing protein [bacterium]HQP99751.1 carboxypeptidase regulatory-like domain-containing protein [bacterium]